MDLSLVLGPILEHFPSLDSAQESLKLDLEIALQTVFFAPNLTNSSKSTSSDTVIPLLLALYESCSNLDSYNVIWRSNEISLRALSKHQSTDLTYVNLLINLIQARLISKSGSRFSLLACLGHIVEKSKLPPFQVTSIIKFIQKLSKEIKSLPGIDPFIEMLPFWARAKRYRLPSIETKLMNLFQTKFASLPLSADLFRNWYILIDTVSTMVSDPDMKVTLKAEFIKAVLPILQSSHIGHFQTQTDHPLTKSVYILCLFKFYRRLAWLSPSKFWNTAWHFHCEYLKEIQSDEIKSKIISSCMKLLFPIFNNSQHPLWKKVQKELISQTSNLSDENCRLVAFRYLATIPLGNSQPYLPGISISAPAIEMYFAIFGRSEHNKISYSISPYSSSFVLNNTSKFSSDSNTPSYQFVNLNKIDSSHPWFNGITQDSFFRLSAVPRYKSLGPILDFNSINPCAENTVCEEIDFDLYPHTIKLLLLLLYHFPVLQKNELFIHHMETHIKSWQNSGLAKHQNPGSEMSCTPLDSPQILDPLENPSPISKGVKRKRSGSDEDTQKKDVISLPRKKQKTQDNTDTQLHQVSIDAIPSLISEGEIVSLIARNVPKNDSATSPILLSVEEDHPTPKKTKTVSKTRELEDSKKAKNTNVSQATLTKPQKSMSKPTKSKAETPKKDTHKPNVVCINWLHHRCYRGTDCPYLHEGTQLTFDTICKFFRTGSCTKGDACPFSHNLKSEACNNMVIYGKCKFGEKCSYSHDNDIVETAKAKIKAKRDEEEREKLEALPFLDSIIPLPAANTTLVGDNGTQGTQEAMPVLSFPFHPDDTGVDSSFEIHKQYSELPEQPQSSMVNYENSSFEQSSISYPHTTTIPRPPIIPNFEPLLSKPAPLTSQDN